MWRERERGKQRDGINSSLFAPFISLSKGNAFVDAIVGGMDEMIRLEINCCFEQRQQSTGTQQDWCGKKEVFQCCGWAAGEGI